jgi:ankyrin repeat protein
VTGQLHFTRTERKNISDICSERYHFARHSSSPASVVIGDFNGDNKMDMAVANQGGDTVSVLLGRGNGTFQPQQTYLTGSSPAAVAMSDINGDNKIDIAVANQMGGTVSVLLGHGDGTFQAQQTYLTGGGPVSVAVGDFNDDNKIDMAVASQVANHIWVDLNQCN